MPIRDFTPKKPRQTPSVLRILWRIFFTEFNLLNWYDIWKDTLPNPKTKKDVSIAHASGGVYLFDNKGQLKYFVHDDENKQNRAPYYNQYKNKYSGNDSRGWHCPYLITSNYL